MIYIDNIDKYFFTSTNGGLAAGFQRLFCLTVQCHRTSNSRDHDDDDDEQKAREKLARFRMKKDSVVEPQGSSSKKWLISSIKSASSPGNTCARSYKNNSN